MCSLPLGLLLGTEAPVISPHHTHFIPCLRAFAVCMSLQTLFAADPLLTCCDKALPLERSAALHEASWPLKRWCCRCLRTPSIWYSQPWMVTTSASLPMARQVLARPSPSMGLIAFLVSYCPLLCCQACSLHCFLEISIAAHN